MSEPETGPAFKKIFGSDGSRDILINFANADIDLAAPAHIVDVATPDPPPSPSNPRLEGDLRQRSGTEGRRSVGNWKGTKSTERRKTILSNKRWKPRNIQLRIAVL
ncbi:MAG: hypothetical protein P4M00_06290 [Azospirillaceae bacterium]|nr:hypothetical protein [Azospirillaceae bacterium]